MSVANEKLPEEELENIQNRCLAYDYVRSLYVWGKPLHPRIIAHRCAIPLQKLYAIIDGVKLTKR